MDKDEKDYKKSKTSGHYYSEGYDDTYGNNYDSGYREEDYDGRVKLKIPLPVWLFLLAIVALEVVCLLRFPMVIDDYKNYALAEHRTETGDTQAAVNDLYLLAVKRNESDPILMKAINIAMKTGYYDIAYTLINDYIAGRGLSSTEYGRLGRYYDTLERYYKAYDAVLEVFKQQPAEGDESYKRLNEELLLLTEDSGMDQAYLYYWLGITETDTDIALNYFRNCYELDPECLDVRVQLSVSSRRAGEGIMARIYAEEAIRKEKKDSGALRALATIELSEGYLEEGLKLSEEAYRIAPEGIFIRDTYMIALHANNKVEEALAVKDEIIKAGLALDEDTEKVLSDELSLSNYYISN